jgi:hypothetical protein
MAIYWHPLLAQFLTHYFSDRIHIQDSVPLGEMPLEMDLLLIPSIPIALLPYPFNYLGPRTIGEFKGPGDSANWETVSQLESYACLYQMREKIPSRDEITLWVIASEFSESFFPLIDNLTPIGEGVQQGTLSRFPIYQIDLETLPITVATFPMLMVYSGNEEREKEIVQFFIEHYQEFRELGFFIETLHPIALKEVLQSMNIESLRGFDLDFPAIVRLFGKERFIQTIGQKEILQTMDAKEILQNLTHEQMEALEALIEQERQNRKGT